VLAKVHRDRLMVKMHRSFPQYGFDKHKGYGTKLHLDMIKKHGVKKVHRKSFAPVRNALASLRKGKVRRIGVGALKSKFKNAGNRPFCKAASSVPVTSLDS